MLGVSNTDAVGFDNLSQRDGSFDSAHGSVFDKMLADYYLSLRGEYADSNKVMTQLTSIFETKRAQKKHIQDNGAPNDLY